jgi:glycosyltransferase involved in cell wall biosynthesis
VALLLGDAFVCASERQRDLWLGSLAALGRLTPDVYAADPSLRSLVEVVPFGLDVPKTPPAVGVVARTFPSIAPTDRVLLWGGGIWNWLDPLTVIRAVGRLAERREDVKLVFLGLQHPSAAVERMRMADRAIALADELGLTSRSVHFNRVWVPYDERSAWFGDAAIGVSAHVDSAEARYAFRTRLLDHIAVCTPLVVTEGDVLGELVRERGLGVAVAPGDVDAWVTALGRLLDDEGLAAAARSALSELRGELTWERVVEPLARLLDAVASAPAASRSARLDAAAARIAQLRSSVARRGVARTARALLGAGEAPDAREQ